MFSFDFDVSISVLGLLVLATPFALSETWLIRIQLQTFVQWIFLKSRSHWWQNVAVPGDKVLPGDKLSPCGGQFLYDDKLSPVWRSHKAKSLHALFVQTYEETFSCAIILDVIVNLFTASNLCTADRSIRTVDWTILLKCLKPRTPNLASVFPWTVPTWPTGCTTDPSPNHWRSSFFCRSGKNVKHSPAGSDVIITTFVTIIL